MASTGLSKKAPPWQPTHFPSLNSMWVNQEIDFPVTDFTVLLLVLGPHSGTNCLLYLDSPPHVLN